MQIENSQKQTRFEIHFKKFIIFSILTVVAGVLAYGQLDIPNMAKTVSAIIMMFFAGSSALSFIRATI
ncbi:hypothetical protein [uncultured Psychrobacter sp.]|uniref:hypothetical protein n=1 Tax=uncultured Psychrobacter sp. TaxID=259303 RepID=UPI0030D89B3D